MAAQASAPHRSHFEKKRIWLALKRKEVGKGKEKVLVRILSKAFLDLQLEELGTLRRDERSAHARGCSQGHD